MSTPSTNARDGFASVTVGTLLMLLGTLGFVAQGFVARVILARSLTPVEWGQFSIGLTLAGLLSAIGGLGLPSAIARSLPFAHGDDDRRAIVHSSFLVTLASSVVIAVGLFAFGVYVGNTYGHGTLSLTIELFAVAVAFTILSTWIASIFQGYEDVLPNALFLQVVNPGLFIVFLVAVLKASPSGALYLGALLAYVGAAVATLVALSLYARRRLGRRLPDGPRAPGAAGALFRFAAPLFIVTVLGFVTGNADTLIVGVYHQPSVGFYTAALSLARLVPVGVGALSYIYLPVAARFIRAGDHDSVRLTYVTATKWMVLTSLSVFVVFFFLPGSSLSFVYGSAYRTTTAPLQVLVAGAFLSTLVGPAAAAQVSYGQTRLLVLNNAVSAALDVGLSFALIPGMGITGAAIAWASANALNAFLSVIELAIVSDLHPAQAHYLVPLLVTTLPIAAAFWLIPVALPFWSLPVLVLAVALAFFLVVLVTGSIDRGDRLVLEVVEGMLGRPIGLLRRLGAWGVRRRWGRTDR
jgi:O-antigen/teichoic acid export membrane protein